MSCCDCVHSGGFDNYFHGISEDSGRLNKRLYSQWGSVFLYGCPQKRPVYDSATAYTDVKIDHGIVLGKVKAEWGNVTANQSKLGDVIAHNNIDLTNSSAKDLHSRWGHALLGGLNLAMLPLIIISI